MAGVGEGFLDVIRPLLALTVNLTRLMKEELKHYRAVPEKDWPLPRGYRVRVAAAYLCWVYSQASSAEAY